MSIRWILRPHETQSPKVGNEMRAHRSREAGFTYMETVIALLIIVLLSGGGLLLFRGAWSGALESAARFRELREILAAEEALRKAAARIAFPWWREEPGIITIKEGFRIAYLDGGAGEYLELRLEDSEACTLLIEAGGESLRLPLPERTTLTVDKTEVRLTTTLGVRSVEIRAAWTGRSIYREP